MRNQGLFLLLVDHMYKVVDGKDCQLSGPFFFSGRLNALSFVLF